MKICYLGNPNDAHVRRWVKNLADWGYEVHLAGCEKCAVPPPKGVVFYDFARWFNLPKARFAVWGAALFVLVRQIRPQVLHAHTAFGAGWLAPAALWRPLAVSAHGSDLLLLDQKPLPHATLTRLALKKADKVLCVSPQLAAKALELGVPEARIEALALGLDAAVFHPGPPGEEFARHFDLGQGPVFYFCRVLKPLYNPMLAAESFRRVLKDIPSARMLVPLARASQDALREFRACLESNHAIHAVRFVPPLDGDAPMAALYRTAHVSLSLASSDGAPQSVRESMACGTPVIAGNIPALASCVRDGRDGLLIPLDDPQALADAMIRLARDQALRSRLGQNGARAMRENFSLQTQEKMLRAFYQNLAALKDNP